MHQYTRLIRGMFGICGILKFGASVKSLECGNLHLFTTNYLALGFMRKLALGPVLMVQTSVRYGKDIAAVYLHAQHHLETAKRSAVLKDQAQAE